jgi:hypothetical protein
MYQDVPVNKGGRMSTLTLAMFIYDHRLVQSKEEEMDGFECSNLQGNHESYRLGFSTLANYNGGRLED